MNKIITILITLLILILIGSNVFFAMKYRTVQQGLYKVSEITASNEKILTFNKLFITKVLESQGEVSYEDRLKLENAVSDTGDTDIKNAWKNFLASATEAEAQKNVLALLNLFPAKVKNLN